MVHGERDEQRRFYTLWKRMVDDRPAILMSAKSAAFRASRTHVDNAAHAVVVAATDDRARGRVYNVSEPEALTWTQWARLVAAQLRWNGELVVAPSDQMPMHLRDSRPDTWDHHLVAETSRIRHELGYQELVGRDEGLARALAWYAESPQRIRPLPRVSITGRRTRRLSLFAARRCFEGRDGSRGPSAPHDQSGARHAAVVRSAVPKGVRPGGRDRSPCRSGRR